MNLQNKGITAPGQCAARGAAILDAPTFKFKYAGACLRVVVLAAACRGESAARAAPG